MKREFKVIIRICTGCLINKTEGVWGDRSKDPHTHTLLTFKINEDKCPAPRSVPLALEIRRWAPVWTWEQNYSSQHFRKSSHGQPGHSPSYYCLRPNDSTTVTGSVNPLNPELNPICYLLALLAHHFLHVSRIRVKSLTIRLLMSYIYGAPILDVSRSHTTTQHSR